MLRKIKGIVVFILFGATVANAGTIVAGPGVTQLELDAYTQATGAFGFARHEMATRVDDAQRLKLKNLLEKAQAAYLGQTLPLARMRFREISEQATAADWNGPQREAIQYSLLRLAQTSETPTERDEWLSRSARLFPDLIPANDLFPPPLLTEYRLTLERVRASSVQVNPGKIFPGYRFVTIDGFAYPLDEHSSIDLPPGEHRVSAYSDSKPTFSDIVKAERLNDLRFNFEPLVSGTCDQPIANSDAFQRSGLNRAEVLFPGGCLKDVAPVSPMKAAEIDFRPTKSVDPIFDRSENAPMSKAKRDWIWIGVAVLAAGAAYAIYQDSHRDQGAEPVHTNGF